MRSYALYLLLSLWLCQSTAFGQSVVSDSNGGTTTATGNPSSTSPSINPAANQGQSSQNSGALANMAAGAALMAACMMTTPPNLALCALGALAMAQGAADSGAGNQSGNTAGLSNASGTNPAGTTPATPAPGLVGDPSGTTSTINNGTPGGSTTAGLTQAGQAALANAGYVVTPAGVTTPSGTTVPASSFGTASGMSAAGFGASDIQDAQKAIADLNKNAASGATVSGVATNDSGGGGPSMTNGAGAGGSSGLSALNIKNPFALTNEAKKGLVAGKTVLLDGEPIGVRGDDIFEMVHKAYTKKRERNAFLETTIPGAPLRMPASTLKGLR
jgi:hypothetical protein